MTTQADWTTLAIPFGSAVLGAIVGYLGAFWLHQSDVRAERRGSARAVYYEVRRNAATIGAALESPMLPMPLERSSYDACIPILANFLGPSELEPVTLAYIQHENVLRIIADAERRSLIELTTEQRSVLEIMLKHQVEAIRVLLRRGFNEGEQRQLPPSARPP